MQQPRTLTVSSEAAAAFSGQVQHLAGLGAYSVPVRIEGVNSNDQTPNGYETPSFIHKKENILTGMVTNQVVSSPIMTIENSVHSDSEALTKQLDVCKTKAEKAKVCKYNF
jgi:hypothetical protein